MTGESTYRYFLMLPSLALFAAMILHSLRVRGKDATIWFFALGAPFFYLRELYVSKVPQLANLFTFIIDRNYGKPEYWHPFAVAKVWDVPVAVVVGWLMVAYLSWYLGERIAAHHPGTRGRLFAIAWFSAVSASTMAFVVEATGVRLGWWVWAKWETMDRKLLIYDFLHRAPSHSLTGWGVSTMLFLLPFFLIYGSGLRHLGARRYWFIALLPVFLALVYVIPMPWGTLRRSLFFAVLTALALWHPLKLALPRDNEPSPAA